jgi:ketosteroid isomerase-like protein
MTQQNADALRDALEAFNRGDRAEFLAHSHADAVNVPPADWPENAPIRGAEGIWDFYVDAIKAWDGASFHWGELIDPAAPETIVANQRAELRGKMSGAEVIWTYWVVFRFRDGKVVHSAWFGERDEALRAAAG